jgi:uncharacterized membrane protein YbhN (UPF0104 family)
VNFKKYIWPIIGVGAVVFSIWLLYHELRGLSIDELWDSLSAIPATDWLCAVIATFVAYGALAAYDHLALLHLRKRVSWLYMTVCSFTTYALSHNIGASVFSGSVVRYRAYTAKGLSGAEVGVLVAFCSFTFALGSIMLTGLVLIIEPEIAERFVDVLPVEATSVTGMLLLGLVGLYVLGSVLRMRPLKLGSFEVHYPKLSIVLRQLVIAPIELIGAAAIIYFALPEALLSHAPGGLGVLELVFITGLSEMDPADVLAALLVFRLLYLIIPFIIALFVVLGFERMQLAQNKE